jgi:hypothetical protein
MTLESSESRKLDPAFCQSDLEFNVIDTGL